ncbi:MAPEG family protein [Ahrensia sp. R2A130]|uniref:MAPEG family protein n=1 Tax=Ahrensia sp. R2A130 TaxID=744979 RepID=UPI0001E0F0EF|nr:MAPEG family protein [Ahrensia sp. R2A130]EFL89017.1 membrane-associated protein in eicosanoid and glutathione metabolism [Ahrensia sp. R2A130]
MSIPVTTFATLLLAGLYVALTMRVIGARRAAGVSLGDGGDERLIRTMRGQGNFVENVPIALMLIFVIEMQTVTLWAGAFDVAFIATTCAFVLGRMLHGIAFGFTMNWPLGRVGGMMLTLFSMLFLLVLAIFAVLV